MKKVKEQIKVEKRERVIFVANLDILKLIVLLIRNNSSIKMDIRNLEGCRRRQSLVYKAIKVCSTHVRKFILFELGSNTFIRVP